MFAHLEIDEAQHLCISAEVNIDVTRGSGCHPERYILSVFLASCHILFFSFLPRLLQSVVRRLETYLPGKL